jgi:hypothetical protein
VPPLLVAGLLYLGAALAWRRRRGDRRRRRRSTAATSAVSPLRRWREHAAPVA